MQKPSVRAREQTERTVTGNNHSPDEDVPMCRHQQIMQFGYTYAALPEKDTTPQPLQLSLTFGTKESQFFWTKLITHAIQRVTHKLEKESSQTKTL